MAENAQPFRSFIDPDDPIFTPAGNIPDRIRDYCRKTNQDVPRNEAEIVRCINESLAFKYRIALEEIEDCTDKKYSKLYMLGGGTQSRLLSQMTANASNIKVYGGPIEATVLGNIAIQLIASGNIKRLERSSKNY